MFDSPYNSSYRLGFDHRYTQTCTFFFTFYSQFGSRQLEARLEAALLLGVLFASILTNSFLVAALIKARNKTVTNCFLMSLCFADSLFALGIPAVVAVRLNPEWAIGDFLCRLLPYSQLVCGFTVLWSLTFISVERYRCLTLDPRLKLSVSSAGLVVLIMWLLAMALFSPILFWFHHEEDLGICTIMFPRAPPVKVSLLFTVVVTIFVCLLPMAILVFNYQRIFMKMIETRQRWSTPCVLTSSLTRQEQQRMQKHIRVMRISLMNMAVVLLMWLPITVVLCLIYIDGDRPLEDTGFFLRSHHFLFALSIALLNTAINPILIGAIKFACCRSDTQGPPSLSRLIRIGSSVN
ncbi:free fatty acid receptor 4 [Halyomorpha halys]|uniref:free fatty acid receptor 4 n=1 Tax=Halyomorpha halys TaxID=286706 RepID=UPI0006D4C7D1|nr:neuropeptide Y receptor type 2-like [Halyomorpha halys]